MLINANAVVTGDKILLVPYAKHHVEKYHSWMQSEEIRELTASLPLTLDEEYQMQQTWLNDKDKCTFIVLDRERYNRTHDEIDSMIGDVNLFLNDQDDIHCGEIEIMIAEGTARHKGYGLETLVTFMRYAIETLGVTRFVAKVGLQNAPSIRLFTDKLQFLTMQTSEVFQEVTMELCVDRDVMDRLRNSTPSYSIEVYDRLKMAVKI